MNLIQTGIIHYLIYCLISPMAKCPCMQAIWKIDDAWDEQINYEEGESLTSCKRVKELMLSEIKYAKECKWCPCRKRKSLDDEVFEEPHANPGLPIDECVSALSDNRTENEGARVIQGPCECSVAIARLAALLDRKYGSNNPRKVDPAQLPTDIELTEIYQAYSVSRGKCSRCGPGSRLDSNICSCRNAWDRRQHLIYLIDTSVDDWVKYIPILRSEFPEIELNWVHESKRCLACKERNKDCRLEYRALVIAGRIWKTQLRFPNFP